jgi:hypothetical protein
MSGADYVITAAHDAAVMGAPFARWLWEMASTAVLPSESASRLETAAHRPLAHHEASALAIIGGAYRTAMMREDAMAAEEIVMFGLALLAKWPDYLATAMEAP